MHTVLLILSILFLIIALLLCVPVRAIIAFYKNPGGSGLEISVKVAFLKFKLHPSKADKSETPKKKAVKEKTETPNKKKSVKDKITDGIELYKLVAEDAKDIIGYTVLKAFYFEYFRFRFHYGTGNAASTGIFYGVISGIVYGLTGAIANSARTGKSEIEITPDFTQSVSETDGECIVKIRIVHIMVIVSKLLKLYLKIKKGKERD